MAGSPSQEPPPDKRSYSIQVVGAKRVSGDWYHWLLRTSWTVLVSFIAGAFLFTNALFAVAYMVTGGVAHSRAGSFADAFYFSVQTMGTVGYGAMYPESQAANVVMVAQSVVSLIFTALATGLVFSKFARPLGRVAFSRRAVISLMDGVPTLMVRVGNERGNTIVEATVHVTMSRTVRTAEGQTFYRLVDLPLARERSPAVARSWTIMHAIDERSPIRGATPETFASEEVELIVSLFGTDDTSYQPVHARHEYEHMNILWGARYADVLSETPDGNLVLDVRRFHDVVKTEPTAAFPYPKSTSPS
ncbi:MAG TPA: ion channel [Polyangiaceae bacterium]|jgi:inward rectifier potassium channel